MAIIFVMHAATTIFVSTWVSLSNVNLDLAFRPSYLVSGKNLYTLVTYMFVHGNWMHFIFNAIAMAFLGMLFEEKIGTLRFGVLFFATGIISAILYGIATNFKVGGVVGASGAIFGILGAWARLYPGEKVAFFPIPYPLPIHTWVLLFFIGSVFLHFAPEVCFVPNIAHLGHAFGIVVGLFIAPLIMKIPGKERQKKMIKINYEALNVLAQSEEEKELLEKIKSEDEPEVRDAWLEHFLEKVRCPQCEGTLDIKGRTLKCTCGFEVRY